MKVVLSLGGSLVFKDAPQTAFVGDFANMISSIKATFGITVGGGAVNKQYVTAAREFKENNFDLDLLGIGCSQLNARLLKAALKGARFCTSIEEASNLIDSGIANITVMGGTHPGHTTDAVSALLAEKISAERWVNLSNVPCICDKDPNVFKDAKELHSMTHEQLVKLAAEQDKRNPREKFIVDVLATKLLARSNIEAHFVGVKDMADVKSAILGKKHSGTIVKD